MAAQADIDLTLSDDDEEGSGEGGGGVAMATRPSPYLVTPVKSESRIIKNSASAATRANATDACDVDATATGIVEETTAGALKPATTGGKGLWNLWTRNFKSTLLMFLDLVDNSVDAAIVTKTSSPQAAAVSHQINKNTFTGCVQIYRDLYEIIPEQMYATGLCIRNNSPHKIAPLHDVLKLFISAKEHSGTSSIGENGVGLKQSCAALSDLSFVLTKNQVQVDGHHHNDDGDRDVVTWFELGIIAKSLQKEEGCYLPHFKFKGGEGSLGQKMLELFSQSKNKEVASCIAEYGRVRSGGSPSLARGVARLNKRFQDMGTNFNDNPHIFEVIIDKVRHFGVSSSPLNNDTDNKNTAVSDIMKELQHEVSRRYLHIPENFKFTIGKKDLSFLYWQERLVEFSKVEIPCRSEKAWSVEDLGDDTPDSYFLRLFLGFDRYRIADPESGFRKSKKACSLYIYSRHSGRLVQFKQDARDMIGLVNGGTDYCQALTVIIDDVHGKLPLDPTKQGIAFGNQQAGSVHRENLYAVVSGVVKFWYNYQKKKFGGSKALLSSEISNFTDAEPPCEMRTCGELDLTEYGLHFNLTRDNRILIDHTVVEDEIVGTDTIFRLLLENEPADSSSETKQPGASKAPAPKRQTATKAKSPPSKRKKPTKKARATPAKKRKSAPSPPVKKKQPTKKAKASHASSQKKARTKKLPAKEKKSPPKGIRSSRRAADKPARYGYSDDSDCGSDCGDEDASSRRSESDSVEGGNNGDFAEDVIDLCLSSSDEENGEKGEDDSAAFVKEEPVEEPSTKLILTGEDREVIVPCPAIGKGWTQKTRVRKNGSNQCDKFYVFGGKTFRSLVEVNRFLNMTKRRTEASAAKEMKKQARPAAMESPANNDEPKSSADSVSNEQFETESLSAHINDSNTMQMKIDGLSRDNTDLNARAQGLEAENLLLKKEVKRLQEELIQSKRIISVIKNRSNTNG